LGTPSSRPLSAKGGLMMEEGKIAILKKI